MKDLTNVKIAVDFDGTIVEHDYPAIGREIMFAFASLKQLQEQGALLILWTYRTGSLLDAAIDYCRDIIFNNCCLTGGSVGTVFFIWKHCVWIYKTDYIYTFIDTRDYNRLLFVNGNC